MTAFVGKDGVNTFRAIVIKNGLGLYARTGLRLNRAYTPSAMLRVAGEITGKKFKRGQYAEAIEALEDWLAENGTTGESGDV